MCPRRRNFYCGTGLQSQIRQIYVNGKTADKLFKKHIEPNLNRPAICLPSTSPANAAWNLERLVAAWRVIAEE